MNSKLQHGNKWSLQKTIFDKSEAIIKNNSCECKTSFLLHLELLTRISHHLVLLTIQFATSKRLMSGIHVRNANKNISLLINL
jgi:hypothetical protein